MPINGNEISEREQEILRLVATGASNKEIAQRLYISTNTVKVHLRNIYYKIGVNSRTEAAIFAVNKGLVSDVTLRSDSIDNGDFEIETGFAESNIGQASQITHLVAKLLGKPSGLLFLGGLTILLVLIIIGSRIPSLFISSAALRTTPQERISKPTYWQHGASMLFPRAKFAIAEYQNRIFTIAGVDNSGITGRVGQYDPKTNNWIDLMEKPIKVEGVQAAVIRGKIYVPAGKMANGEFTAELEIFDPDLNNWTKGASLPKAINNYALATLDDKLFIFGGWDGANFLDSVYEYDPIIDKWREQAPMPTARGYLGAAVIENKIYLLGGYDGKNALDITEVFSLDKDGKTGFWKKSSPMPERVFGMGVTSLINIIYIIGGESTSDSKSRFNILAFYTDAEEWHSVDVPSVYKIGSNLGVIGLGQYLYIMGGIVGEYPTKENYIYQAIFTTSIPLINK